MGDDHGWDETGYNGHRHVKTPVLDEMAATGLRLDRFYSAHPSCSPTRASIITGRHPNRCGTFSPNWSIRPGEVSIAQILRDAGYTCGHFGKWHLGPVKADSPTNPGALGFQQWLSHDNFFELNPVLSRNGAAPQKIEGEGSEVIVDEAIRFIDQAEKDDRPFFAVVWFGSPHEPYEGLPEDLALYDDLPESYADRKVSLTDIKTGKPTTRPFRDVLRERLAEITAMDRAIGKLREHLKRSGLRDETLVWYCGDNGVPSSGRLDIPFRGQKGLVYEGGIRVPGIIEWPAKITQPRTSDVNAVTSDMLPTLCEIVGVPLPDRPLDGISLTKLFDGSLTRRPQPIGFWMYDTSLESQRQLKPTIPLELQEGTTPLVKMMAGKHTRSFRNFVHPDFNEDDYAGPRAILDNDYKLVVDGKPGGSSEGELFNLRDDPAEKRNLLQSQPEVAARLRKQLRDWQTSVLTSLTTDD
ncbi:sulfatase-like hydrolase/transferase [bacterium]|nr:sulfatase-like hydrolase/transferase [bacterium]